jgi:gliding motility-associated-like protein
VVEVEIISTHENILHLFTPNNDGFNDLWEIPDLASYGKCEVRVYNRWGKLVFSSPDYHNEWDGTSDGVSLPSAAYYFIIKTETEEQLPELLILKITASNPEAGLGTKRNEKTTLLLLPVDTGNNYCAKCLFQLFYG